jgi:hypothetical protein
MKKIEIEYDSCDGTGIYQGFAEPEGVGVVCLLCHGTGCRALSYKPFNGLRKRKGIKTVRRSAGTLIVTGVGPVGGEITYEEFLKGKMP